MKCEICWDKKTDHCDFIDGGWVNVCEWHCKGHKENIKLEFDPLFSWQRSNNGKKSDTRNQMLQVS